MFHGRANLTLDNKGRLAVPAKYRDALNADGAGQLVVTADSNEYLLIYPKAEWNGIHQKLMRVANANPIVKQLQRMLVGNAQEAEIDSAGRILISPELRHFAGLEKNVTLVGLGAKFELWDETRWTAKMSEPLALDSITGQLDGFSW
ncbi:MAG: division/cell wall cluster transcriptional repressor MraZ [Burkholderiales bacterium]|nr:division/cell wall cluster transcriptional repressor MraZ [Burkholderiales bacterium]